MKKWRAIIVGGGPSGFFAAIRCAEAHPDPGVCVLEGGPRFLSKVRISGGGRCNVTHACFEPRELSGYYPRGGQELLGAFHAFQPRDTVRWFEARGVRLKAEPDGRIFPVTDSSQTVVDCLLRAAEEAGVQSFANRAVRRVARREEGWFAVETADGGVWECERLMLATGGCRGPGAGGLAVSLGHKLETPVPSLFTFEIRTPWLQELAGIPVSDAEVSVQSLGLRERGPLLITHRGLSGPVILRLSAWGARGMHALNYAFPLRINWVPHCSAESLHEQLEGLRMRHSAGLITNTPFPPLAHRLWQQIVQVSGIVPGMRWAELSGASRHQLVQQLTRTGLQAAAKSLNKEEFVTCGGVRLREVDFKTMQSRKCRGLFLGGELLDIDGLTGGFNFQAAWTTGWLAGKAMAGI